MPAIFAQPTADENLQPGWNVQGTGTGQATSGVPGAGYGQAANTTLTYGPGQLTSGVPIPQGALNIGAENAGSQNVAILTNAGYADATGPATRVLPANIGGTTVNAPAIASATALTNPTGLAALVTIAGGTVTQIKVGGPGQTYAQMTTVAGTSGTFTVPPGGTFGITYSVVPTTYTWTV